MRRIYFYIGIILILILTGCLKISKDQIYGIWYSEISEKEDGTTVEIKGTTEYMRNGTFNSIALFLIKKREGVHNIEFAYDVILTGEWELHNSVLVEKIVDIKSIPKYLKQDSVSFDLSEVLLSELNEIPRLEDFIPKGISEELTIVECNADKIKIKTKDMDGRELEYYIYKREKHYES